MKQFFALLCVILAILSIIYGALKPYKKASAYVDAVKAESATVQEFVNLFKYALDYPSPIGQDEMIRFVSNDISNVIAGGKNDEIVAQTLVDFLHQYADPKIESGVGMNYTQLVMMLGTIHTNMWNQYNSVEDYDKAVTYFVRGYNINPDRPQFLIGLLELYQATGDQEKADKIQEHIKELWGS
ncbi:hypothetical protein C4565_02170 [Candidatus Parcubacteria bacterium]|jgi:tetratricopeptide (TPR) repeat protein|nr:MAG: hypothetical protein C4565_02170 [Candidatus Parcubacteria bacterium]